MVDKTLYVSIDIAKNVHEMAAFSGIPLELIEPGQKIRNNLPGYEHFKAWLMDKLTRYERVIVGHEPTGIYHRNWSYALMRDFDGKIDYHFVNAYAVKQRRKGLLNGRDRKTDPIDCRAIAHCLLDGQRYPAFLPSGQELRFAAWVRSFRALKKEKMRLVRQLLGQVDQLWPGALIDVKKFKQAHPKMEVPIPLLLSKPLERKLLRAIILHDPDPYVWQERSLEETEAALRCITGRGGPKKSRIVSQVAQNALLPPRDLVDVLIECLQSDFERYLRLEEHLDKLKAQTEELVPDSPAAVLTTVPGISPFLAAGYLCYVGHYQRFENAGQIWDLAGLAPDEDSSGDSKRMGKISKRGAPGFRDILFLIGQHTSQNVAAIGRARAAARARGKGHVGAVLHAAHKANRLCYRLLYNQVPFDAERYK